MHILITNQHGENRGDEAAMQGMLRAMRGRFPGARFTLLYQYRDRDYLPPVDGDVECLPIVMPLADAAALAAAAALRAAGMRGARPTRGSLARRVWDAYASCDAVVSAPGGPYFGDLYAGHEPVHMFLVWLGRLHGKPLYLFAPSCGPFENRALNPLRRRLFGWFDGICLREENSARYLRALTGIDAPVTADSAFLDPLSPLCETRRSVVTVTALVHRAWADSNGPAQRAYEDALLAAIQGLAGGGDFEFVFLPQLAGAVHSDVDYLNGLGRRLPGDVRWRVLDRDVPADGQRRLIATSCLSIATRYHHQVFSIAAATPCVAICYEHKSTGLMQRAGMSEFAIDIGAVSGDALLAAARTALERSDELQRALAGARVALRRRALRTARMLVPLRGGAAT